MSDSIRENRTWEDVVQEIKMEFDADIERKCSIVLVEGKDDCRFIRKIFWNDVIAIESPSGKSELEKIILDERVKNNRLIAIRDKDYMNIAKIFNILNQTPERLSECFDEANAMCDDMLWNITNGHDFYRLLATKTKVGGKLTNENGVMQLILGLYRLEEFKSTDLYKDLCTYQSENEVKFVDM